MILYYIEETLFGFFDFGELSSTASLDLARSRGYVAKDETAPATPPHIINSEIILEYFSSEKFFVAE